MRLISIEIKNFRGIKECKLGIPNKRVLCFIGAGDSTKTTLLEAVRLNLLQSWSLNCTDADFYQCDTMEPIIITCSYTDYPESLIAEDKYGLYLRSISAIISSLSKHHDESWDDEPKDEEETCLTVQLTIDSSLEPRWEIICNRLKPKNLGLADRRIFACNSIGIDFNSDFVWGRNSILHRYADGKGELRSAYHEAFRTASKAINFDKLNSISSAVITAGKQYSVPLEGEITNKMVMKPNGFSSDVELYDGKAPFSQRGLGSRRLLSIGLNTNSTDEASLLLIDEVETGLEPYRVCQLISELKRSHTERGQVLMTTHCPSAIAELSADELIMVNSHGGNTTIHVIGNADLSNIQGIMRRYPEAFLSKCIVVCEGKTEVGLIRALDNYLFTNRGFHLAYKGVSPVDGSGGSSSIQLAKFLNRCGYIVSLLIDSDVKDDNDEKPSLQKSGITIFDWNEGFSIEEQVFFDVGKEVAEKLIALVVDKSNIKARHQELNSITTVCDIVGESLILKEGLDEEQRKRLGTIAKNNNKDKQKRDTSWFKRIDHGVELGRVLFESYDEIDSKTQLRKTLDSLIEWVSVQ